MEYKDLKKVNAEIKTTDIKGKDYADVSQRITAFRKLYPEGFIRTTLVSCSGGIVVIHAEAGFYDENGEPMTLGTGYAYEKENSTYINKTSYIENCETSAVGRALGMIGIGIDTSVASADEVRRAISQQEAMDKKAPAKKPAPKKKEEARDPDAEPATDEDKANLMELCETTGLKIGDVCKKLGYPGGQLTKGWYLKIRRHLEEHLKEIEEAV